MTDTPKKPEQDTTPGAAELPPTKKRGLPSLEELKARGFIVPPLRGESFGLPLSRPPAKKD